jgi:hypothetical protein
VCAIQLRGDAEWQRNLYRVAGETGGVVPGLHMHEVLFAPVAPPNEYRCVLAGHRWQTVAATSSA